MERRNTTERETNTQPQASVKGKTSSATTDNLITKPQGSHKFVHDRKTARKGLGKTGDTCEIA